MSFNLQNELTAEEKKDFESLKSNEAKRLFIQAVFKRNFKAFVYLLGYRDIGQFHLAEIERISKVRFLEDKLIRRLWLWSRGFFKTSLITEAHLVWLIVNNPNIRVLVASYTLDVSKTMLKNIKDCFVKNEDFRYFFREFCPKASSDGKIEFGTTENFVVPNRTKVLKEPTVLCAGVGTNLTGLHFDYMKLDDLVNKDSVVNETQIQASKDYYSSLRQLFDNPTIPREDIVGTIYHFADLYSELIKNADFEKSIIPVRNKEGIYAFPERIDEEGFRRISEDPSMNPYDVQSQYFLNPINPKDAKFKEEWLKYYDDILDGLAEYICVDPASTQKKKSDYTVIERWGVDADGNHYLLEGVRDKLTVFERMDKIISVVRNAKRLIAVKYEVLGGRHGDLESLKKRFLDEHLPIQPVETKNTTSSKTDRIEQRLVGQFAAGKIFLPRSLVYRSVYDGKMHDFVQEYKMEFLQFPFTEHDDALDCHSQMFEELANIVKGIRRKQEHKTEGLTADDWERFYNEPTEIRKRNPLLNDEQVKSAILFQRVKSMRLRYRG